MKKTFILLCMVAGLVSCAKEASEQENMPQAGIPMTFNVSVLETKAAKTDWADGDKIYVFFNGLETKYLILERSSGAWTNTSGGGTLMDTDFSSLGTKTLTAVHFPVAVDVAYADSKFSFTSGGKPVYNYYLFDAGETYTVDGTTVTATLSMGKPADMVQIHVAGIQANVSDYTFGCSKIKPVACASVGTDGAITESDLQAGARLSGIADADGGIFAGRLTKPGEAADYKFTVASDDYIYTLTRIGKTITAGKMYNFPTLSTTGGDNWDVTAASDLYVDLGLSVKWAKYNVGATTETGSGNYFAWGEVTGYNEGKTNFVWDTYIYGNAYNTLTKYCYDSGFGKDGFADGIRNLLPEDDAAYAALGGKFRMPTDTEWAELRSNCTWVRDTDNNGLRVTSKKTGYTSNSIFLPFTGYMDGTSLIGANNNLVYWFPSLATYPHWGLHFQVTLSGSALIYNSNSSSYSYDSRSWGYPIRPVRE